MRLVHAVRSSLSPSRTRCRLITPCCRQLLIGTKRMLGREAASQMAAASVASFLPLLPSMGYGLTKPAAISRASRPIARSRRAQWCALVQASMVTMHPWGNCTHQAMNCSRLNARHITRRPVASTACTWIHLLGQIHPYLRNQGSCNLARGTFPLQFPD